MTLSPSPTSPSPTSNASGSVLREYTSPTCKLQISANPSALEKWTRKPTLKNQRFLLSFEDPRLSEDQWVTLRGDRLKLAALTETVTTYVQDFLSQSRSIAPVSNPIDLLDSPTPDTARSTQGIQLQPKGLLAHTLTLGTIATETTGDSLNLTSTQLADLASVLDEHGTATLDLPVLNRDTAWMRSPTTWGKIAAFSLLSVGITASVLNQFNPKQTPIQIASQASSSDQRITPPQVPQPTSPPSGFVSPSSKLPGQQLPPIGNPSTPPIAADSNTGNATTPSTSNPATSNPATTQKTAPSPVESTAKAEPKSNVTANTEKIPPLKVQSAPIVAPPQAAAADLVRRRSKPMNSEESAKPGDPEPPDLTPQIDSIRSKVPQKWKPPEKFSNDLKYTLEIAPNGTILSKNLDGQNIPEAQLDLSIGSTIAPALPLGSSSYKVQVIFLPDGSISVVEIR